MSGPIRTALTRRRNRGRYRVNDEPSENLVLGVKFAIAMTSCLSALEVVHVIFMGSWNSEIFAAITGLSGTVIGLFVGQNA